MRTPLDDLSILQRSVVRDPAVDPRAQPGFGSDHQALLDDIDGTSTVLELISTWGRLGAERALTALLDLHRWGAFQLADAPPPFEVARAPTPIELEEQRLLAEDVELDPPTKRRILAATALLRERRVLELLGVEKGADRIELKRAYYALAKEFHPDRFFGKRLGSYGALLTRVFDASSQAIKTLVDQRTAVRGEGATSQRQRRRAPRYAYRAPLRMRCESWHQTIEITTRQVGSGGMFVATERTAAIGERTALELVLPDQSRLRLDGTIVALVPGDGRSAGLCVQLAPMPEPVRIRYGLLLEEARATVPGPVLDEDEPTQRIARGSGSHRTVTPVIGIDLGTTYVSVAATVEGRVHVLPFPSGARAMPSVVAFPRRGEVVVGEEARDRLARDPRHAIASAKRLLGRRGDDKEIQGQLATAGYVHRAGPGGDVLIEMWDEPIAVPQLCGHLLAAARENAERVLGQPVHHAVLTVPVSFGPDRIALLQRAAHLAHLEVIDMIDEPSAAALANRFRPEFGGLVGVYDFGGGTFDFSVVDATGGDFRVLSSAGDSWLGGDDFDHIVADAVANLFWRANNVDLRQRAVEWQQLVFAIERAKCELSNVQEAMVIVPEAMRTADGPVDLRARLKRRQVERIWQPLIDRSLNTCLQALTMAGLGPEHLSAVYLSGGTTHIPMVHAALETFFGTAPVVGVPPDFAVCLGAGVHAAQLEQLRAPTLTAR